MKNKTKKRARQSYVNRTYKDALFRKVFNDKERLLALYNAINRTNYTNKDDLVINTLDNFIFMSVRNDVSFIIGGTLNLYEHQSTICPNMPLRGFLYMSDLLKVYIKDLDLDIYGSVLIKIPLPQCVVFYNGKAGEPDRTNLYLRDSFLAAEENLDQPVDFKVVMLNINYGHNRELMEQCRPLEEYAIFVDTLRGYLEMGYDIVLAAQQAVDDCIHKNILKSILLQGGIVEMIATCYDEELHKKSEAKYHHEQGLQEGRQEKLLELVRKKLIKGQNIEQIAEALEEDPAYVEELIKTIEPSQ